MDEPDATYYKFTITNNGNVITTYGDGELLQEEKVKTLLMAKMTLNSEAPWKKLVPKFFAVTNGSTNVLKLRDLAESHKLQQNEPHFDVVS